MYKCEINEINTSKTTFCVRLTITPGKDSAKRNLLENKNN